LALYGVHSQDALIAQIIRSCSYFTHRAQGLIFRFLSSPYPFLTANQHGSLVRNDAHLRNRNVYVVHDRLIKIVSNVHSITVSQSTIVQSYCRDCGTGRQRRRHEGGAEGQGHRSHTLVHSSIFRGLRLDYWWQTSGPLQRRCACQIFVSSFSRTRARERMATRMPRSPRHATFPLTATVVRRHLPERNDITGSIDKSC
jgi:hypothetical protein